MLVFPLAILEIIYNTVSRQSGSLLVDQFSCFLDAPNCD